MQIIRQVLHFINKTFHLLFLFALTWNDDLLIFRWENDVKQGFGKVTYASGAYYEGQWHQDKANFNGIMKYSNGDIYEGQVIIPIKFSVA